jgi:2-keto-3-deoxy-L-rhamnonate aldolase RhmA
MKNRFRKAVLDKEPTFGAWMQIGHCAVAEIFAASGFDWVCVDLEHGAIDLERMTDIFRTIDGFDCIPVARLPYNDPVWIHRSLDAGARGLIIPMVNSAQEAEAAITEAKYPPRGRRGFGYSRGNMHGINFNEYIKEANDEIAMIMQIEHKDAIDNLEQIAQVDGVDGFFIGPMDLSGSMGVVGQLDAPEMTAALDKYKKVCKDYNISAGMHIVRPNSDNIKSAIEEGYTLLALGLDNVFIDESSKEVLRAANK